MLWRQGPLITALRNTKRNISPCHTCCQQIYHRSKLTSLNRRNVGDVYNQLRRIVCFSLHLFLLSQLVLHWEQPVSYTGCNRRNGPNFGRVFLMLNYIEKTQNTYIQSWTVWEIIAIENWKLWTSFESTNDSLESYLISSQEHRTTEARVKCISLHFLWRSYSTSCGVSVFGRCVDTADTAC